MRRHRRAGAFPGAPVGRGSLAASAVVHLVLGLALAGTTIVRALPPGSEADGHRVVLARQAPPAPPAPAPELPEPLPPVEEVALPEPVLEPVDPEPVDASEPDPEWTPLPDAWEALRELPLHPVRNARREPAPPPAAPEASAPEDPEPARVEPVLLEGDPPRYPALARRRGWEGVVECRLVVGADGRVERVEVARSSGYAALDEAAREALLAWHFRPGLRGGEAAAFDVLHDVEFRLR